MHTFRQACRETAKLFGSQRRLWIPFIAVAVLEALLVGVVWLAPFPPFSTLLAPPIRYFYGERVLHYPWHLWLLFHAMKHTHLIASTLLGAFLSGAVCLMVRQAHQGRPISLRAALVAKQVRYGAVTISWVLSWAIARGLIEAIGTFAPKQPWVLWVMIGVSILLQSLLAYVIPAIVFNGATWWRAFFESVRETIRYPLSTIGLVIVPSAAVLLFAIGMSENRLMQWMGQSAPEIAVALVAARLVVWTVTDAALTVAIAHLWLLHRVPKAAPASARATAGAPKARVSVVKEGSAVA